MGKSKGLFTGKALANKDRKKYDVVACGFLSGLGLLKG
jgi:hypothetical protein